MYFTSFIWMFYLDDGCFTWIMDVLPGFTWIYVDKASRPFFDSRYFLMLTQLVMAAGPGWAVGKKHQSPRSLKTNFLWYFVTRNTSPFDYN